MIDAAKYLQDRIDDQIAWYDKKSSWNQRRYRRYRVLSIIISLSIPILSGFIGKGHDDTLKVVISIAGASVALIEGLLSLYKFHENWLQYRATAESLKHHRYLFETGATPYNTANAFSLFVQNTEELMAKERLTWVQNNQQVQGNNQPDGGRQQEAASDRGADNKADPGNAVPDATGTVEAAGTADAGKAADADVEASTTSEADAAGIADAGDNSDAGDEAESDDDQSPSDGTKI